MFEVNGLDEECDTSFPVSLRGSCACTVQCICISKSILAPGSLACGSWGCRVVARLQIREETPAEVHVTGRPDGWRKYWVETAR
jgi:hypothetical protein